MQQRNRKTRWETISRSTHVCTSGQVFGAGRARIILTYQRPLPPGPAQLLKYCLPPRMMRRSTTSTLNWNDMLSRLKFLSTSSNKTARMRWISSSVGGSVAKVLLSSCRLQDLVDAQVRQYLVARTGVDWDGSRLRNIGIVRGCRCLRVRL